MTEQINDKHPYIPCAHCNQTGTCSNGNDNKSCTKCTRDALPWIRSFLVKTPSSGEVCSVCKGHGVVEPYTYTLNNRIRPALAAAIIVGAISVIPASLDSEHFDAILAFATTITGAVTGFYFGGSSKKQKF